MEFAKPFMTVREFHRATQIPETAIRAAIHKEELPGFHSGKWFHVNTVKAWTYFQNLSGNNTTPAA